MLVALRGVSSFSSATCLSTSLTITTLPPDVQRAEGGADGLGKDLGKAADRGDSAQPAFRIEKLGGLHLDAQWLCAAACRFPLDARSFSVGLLGVSACIAWLRLMPVSWSRNGLLDVGEFRLWRELSIAVT